MVVMHISSHLSRHHGVDWLLNQSESKSELEVGPFEGLSNVGVLDEKLYDVVLSVKLVKVKEVGFG